MIEDSVGNTKLSDEVSQKEARKVRARKKSKKGALYGFTMFGLVGWSVAVPTLLGVLIGTWLERKYPGKAAWTLNFLIIGIILGCVNAWFWIHKENQSIDEDLKNNDQ